MTDQNVFDMLEGEGETEAKVKLIELRRIVDNADKMKSQISFIYWLIIIQLILSFITWLFL